MSAFWVRLIFKTLQCLWNGGMELGYGEAWEGIYREAVTCQPTSSFGREEPTPPAAGSVVGTQPLAVSPPWEYPVWRETFHPGQHISRDWLKSGSKALPHGEATLKDCLHSRAPWSSTETLIKMHHSPACPSAQSFPFPAAVVYSRTLLINIVHATLHFSFSFPGNPTCDRI